MPDSAPLAVTVDKLPATCRVRFDEKSKCFEEKSKMKICCVCGNIGESKVLCNHDDECLVMNNPAVIQAVIDTNGTLDAVDKEFLKVSLEIALKRCRMKLLRFKIKDKTYL